MTPWICVTCCAEFEPSEQPPHRCPICEDPRQYVGSHGQRWMTELDLIQDHSTQLQDLEPGLLGIGIEPEAGIGQRALLVEHAEGGVMFDGVPLLDEASVFEIQKRGGVRAMVMSHPHLYGTMVTNSMKLGNVPIYIPEADREWVMYPHENVRFFSDKVLDLDHGVTLQVTGGHFDGSSFLHWPQGADNKGAILTGDTIMVTADRRWVTFLWSTPNYVQLGPRAIKKIVKTTEGLKFDRLYSAWWSTVIEQDAKKSIAASAQRIADIQANG